jgi:hypothetical protein
MAHSGDINIHIPLADLIDPEKVLEHANKLVEMQYTLLEPSSVGFAFSSHQRIELQKLLLKYRADAANITIFGSQEAVNQVAQYAGIEARIELLTYLLSSK